MLVDCLVILTPYSLIVSKGRNVKRRDICFARPSWLRQCITRTLQGCKLWHLHSMQRKERDSVATHGFCSIQARK